MKPVPFDEQETIIIHDKKLDEWSFYSNNPTHIRRWIDSIIPNRIAYHVDFPDRVVMLEGIINGSASIRKKIQLTDEEKRKRSELMKETRARMQNLPDFPID